MTIASPNALPLIKHDTRRLAVMVCTTTRANDGNLRSRNRRWKRRQMFSHDLGQGSHCTISNEPKHLQLRLHTVLLLALLIDLWSSFYLDRRNASSCHLCTLTKKLFGKSRGQLLRRPTLLKTGLRITSVMYRLRSQRFQPLV